MSIWLSRIFWGTLFLFTLDIVRFYIYPDVGSLSIDNPTSTAFIDYRIKQWEEKGREKEITQRWVSLNDISPHLKRAVLIGEDDRFYKHDGFDANGILFAIKRTLNGQVAGGSTITQQLAKNLYLSPTKNPARKLKEAILTTRLEHDLSKDRIFELYLNVAEWGDGIFGIEAAAHHYYKKSAKRLTKKEACRLASVLPNPIRFDPKGNQSYVVKRSKTLLKVLNRRQ